MDDQLTIRVTAAELQMLIRVLEDQLTQFIAEDAEHTNAFERILALRDIFKELAPTAGDDVIENDKYTTADLVSEVTHTRGIIALRFRNDPDVGDRPIAYLHAEFDATNMGAVFRLQLVSGWGEANAPKRYAAVEEAKEDLVKAWNLRHWTLGQQ